MPAAKLELKTIKLGEAAQKFLETKNPGTRRAYEKCLKRFRVYYGREYEKFIGEIEGEIDLNQDRSLAERVRPGEDTIRKFIEWHKGLEYSNNATRQSIATLQNALKYYGINVSFEFINLPPARPMKENEKHPWSLDEMRQFVEIADYLRDKAFIMMSFQTGLGIGDIVELNYGDLRRGLEGGELPLLLQLYRKKTGVEHKTFLGRDAVHYLEQYLMSRPDIKSTDPLFTMLGNNRRVTKGAISKQLREYAKKLNFIMDEDIENGYNPARPHSLRSAFRSRLTGKMNETLIEFFMGHNIGEEKKAYINMPDDELRELYSNYEHLLAIEKTSKDEIADLSGKEKIPEEALTRIQGLESTVTMLSMNNAKLEAELERVKAGKNSEVEDLKRRLNEQEKILKLLNEKLQKITL